MRSSAAVVLLVLAAAAFAVPSAAAGVKQHMAAAWCAKHIAGCSACTSELLQADPSAKFPDSYYGGGAAEQVVVRCLACSAPLYVLNVDNQNCDCAGDAGTAYRNSTLIVPGKSEYPSQQGDGLSDVFPPQQQQQQQYEALELVDEVEEEEAEEQAAAGEESPAAYGTDSSSSSSSSSKPGDKEVLIPEQRAALQAELPGRWPVTSAAAALDGNEAGHYSREAPQYPGSGNATEPDHVGQEEEEDEEEDEHEDKGAHSGSDKELAHGRQHKAHSHHGKRPHGGKGRAHAKQHDTKKPAHGAGKGRPYESGDDEDEEDEDDKDASSYGRHGSKKDGRRHPHHPHGKQPHPHAAKEHKPRRHHSKRHHHEHRSKHSHGKQHHPYDGKAEQPPYPGKKDYADDQQPYTPGGGADDYEPPALVCARCPTNSVSKGGLLGGAFCVPCGEGQVADKAKGECVAKGQPAKAS